MTERERFELIDRYFRNELSQSEQDRFQQLWATDPTFAEEVGNHELVNEFVIDAGLLGIKDKLNRYTHPHTGGRSSSAFKGPGKLKLGVIGGSLAITGLGLWLSVATLQPFQPQNETKGQQTPDKHKRDLIVQDSSQGTNTHKRTKAKVQESKNPPGYDSGISKDTRVNPLEENQGTNDKHKRKITTPVEEHQIQNNLSLVDRHNQNDTDFRIQSALEDMNKSPNAIKIEAKIPEEMDSKLHNRLCQTIKVEGDVYKTPSCSDKANGSIRVAEESLTGGRPPYKFSLKTGGNYEESLVKKHLSPGTYTIKVKDGHGCENTLRSRIRIEQKECGERSFVFVPSQQKEWEFPLENEEVSGRLTIFYKGKRVFSENITNGVPNSWNGRLQNGQKCNIGTYKVVFKPKEGVAKIWLLTVLK